MAKKIDQKERILRLAGKKFLAHGFNRVSIDSIVAELHTSKSTVYGFYPTKEDLVRAVIDDLNERINHKLASILGDQSQSFNTSFSQVIAFTAELLSEIDEAFLNDLQVYTPDIWEYYEKLRENRIRTYYRKLFENGLVSGMIRKDMDLDVLLHVYMQLTEIPVNSAIFKNYRHSNQTLYEDISRVFLEGALVRENEKEKRVIEKSDLV